MNGHQHEDFMMQCNLLANQGAGYVGPNPMVGAVLVCNGKMIGAGYHTQFGEAHAEVNCIASVALQNKDLISSSILYVNLEPCNHYGKTPPCSELILKSGIKKVIIGCQDEHALVAGKGIEYLRENGVEVIVGVLDQQCKTINRRFFTFHKNKRPYIILKWAESKDGFTSINNETQTPISCATSQHLSHQWRAQESSILIGFQTAKIDNPKLSARLVSGQQPIRLVLDPKLELSDTLNLKDGTQKTIVFNDHKTETLSNFKLVQVQNWSDIFNKLYEQNILSIIIEGGTKTIQSLISAALWDEARVIKSEIELSNGYRAPALENEKFLYQYPSGTDAIYHYKNLNNTYL
jgi:diaminohydroxyphosphoribosylaminopyrimidine deaminase / 5-amino-6-(5-phosphoribosylamino)uracil reductase